MGLIGQAVRSVDESPGLLRLVGVRLSAMKSARGRNPTMTPSPTSQLGVPLMWCSAACASAKRSSLSATPDVISCLKTNESIPASSAQPAMMDQSPMSLPSAK
jgi:hypothetical protein